MNKQTQDIKNVLIKNVLMKNTSVKNPSSSAGLREIAFFLRQTGASMVPLPILVGAILEVVSSCNTNKVERMQSWRMIGESFLKGSQSCED